MWTDEECWRKKTWVLVGLVALQIVLLAEACGVVLTAPNWAFIRPYMLGPSMAVE